MKIISAPLLFLFINLAMVLVICWVMIGYVTIQDIALITIITILGIAFYIVIISIPGMVKGFNNFKPKSANIYSLFILLLVILFGPAPILVFYNISSEIENNIDTRYKQYEVAGSRESRNLEYARYYERIEDKDSTSSNPARDSVHKSRKEKGIYLDFWNSTTIAKNKLNGRKSHTETVRMDSILHPFRPVYSDPLSVFSKYLIADSSTNRPFTWSSKGENVQLSYYSPTEDITKRELLPMTISSGLLPGNIFLVRWSENDRMNFALTIMIYLLFLGILILVYYLILYTTKKVFAIRLIDPTDKENFLAVVKEQLKIENPVIIGNPSGPVLFEWTAEKIKKDFSAELLVFNDSGEFLPKPGPEKICLIKDFCINYRDPALFTNKLIALKNALKESRNLILLMDIQPDSILKYYQENANANNGTDALKYKSVLELLVPLLDLMVVKQYPIELHAPEKAENSTTTGFITKEIENCKYLERFKETIENYFKLVSENNPQAVAERLTLIKINELAGNYYANLLGACTVEEKFLLFDLSGPHLTNYKNLEIVHILERKGLIVRKDGIYNTMNQSFKNFLLDQYNRNTRKELVKSIDVPNKWVGIKYALWLVIGALFVFLILSNQEYLGNLGALFAALGTSMAGFTRLINTFAGKAGG